MTIMDAISITSEGALSDEVQDKKGKVSDKTKAAMAAGAAGMAAGVGAAVMADSLSAADGVNVDMTVSGHPEHDLSRDAAEETEMPETVEVAAEVNPDDVMLEEPVAEPVVEEDMIAEAQVSEADDYQPFAINDVVEENPLPDPVPDGMLLVEDEDVLFEPVVNPGDYPYEDMICGLPEDDELPIDGSEYMDVSPYAEGDVMDTDIQSDLMA